MIIGYESDVYEGLIQEEIRKGEIPAQDLHFYRSIMRSPLRVLKIALVAIYTTRDKEHIRIAWLSIRIALKSIVYNLIFKHFDKEDTK